MRVDYFSHIPFLAATLTITTGPVLELGTGFGSTLLLHGLCGAQQRKLVSLESDAEWLKEFKNLGRSWHILKHVSDFGNIEEYDLNWGLAFVDHGESLLRGESVNRLKGKAEVIIAHDTCHHFLYNYLPAIESFRYRWDWPIMGPRTSVLSDTVPVNRILAKMNL